MNNEGTALFADVTRLLRRHLGDIRHTGIDRVSLEYGRWVHGRGGGLCIQRFKNLRVLSRGAWGRFLLGSDQPDHTRRDRKQRGQLLVRACIPRRPVTRGSTILVTTHSWLASDQAWKWLATRQSRAVVFVHDLIPIQVPEYSHPREKKLHIRRMRNTLLNARGIIVNSHCTEKTLRDFARDMQLACPPILVNPLGHDLPESAAAQLPTNLRRPYFVLLGTIEPRKNHLLVLTLWREMVRRLGEQTPQLVVIGRRGWECEQVVDMLERCDLIHPHLIELNDAPDGLVAELIRGAQALLMPSFAEGFGMPVQEALAWGTPVLSTPLPAIREFAGDIPDYAEPHDGARWLELLLAYAQPYSPERAAQISRLSGFKETTWSNHFARTSDFLEELA
jgi:glycosyltransferase involved in cell wall biosynthesis